MKSEMQRIAMLAFAMWAMLGLSAQPIHISHMNTENQLKELYHHCWQAMTTKDEAGLRTTHADDFVLVHMTGKQQGLQTYIEEVMNGTLNYHSEKTERVDINMENSTHADVVGRSVVVATVYGGSRHTWHLLMHFSAERREDVWKFTRCEVKTYK